MLKFRIVENKADAPLKIALYNSWPGLLVFSVLTLLQKQRILWLCTLLTGLLLIAGSLLSVLHVRGLGLEDIGIVWVLAGFLIGVLLVFLFILSSVGFLFILENDILGAATQEREQAEQRLNAKPSQGPKAPRPDRTGNQEKFLFRFDLDAKRINEYYVINRQQARDSFSYAIYAMVTGFVTILIGIYLFYQPQQKGDLTPGSLTTLSGVVINIVSLLFIRVHNESQKRSLVYFDQLIRFQQLALSIDLAESMGGKEKIAEKQKIITGILDMAKSGLAQDVQRGRREDRPN